jgi:CheY-like chemotaxis protein
MEPRTHHSEPARKSVLVADGDPQSLRIVDVSLRRAGFDVRSATDGAAALASLEQEPPDLVIADVDLEPIDGFELCRRAKAHPRRSDIRFVFLARPNPAHRIKSIELGADDFLPKPVFVKELVSRVSTLLHRTQRERLAAGDSGSERISGQLADLSMVDLLQSIASNGKSGVVHLRSPAGVRGEVYFRRGAIVDAEVGRLSGADAIYRLFSWSDGAFELEWRNIRRRDTVASSAPALLMEGMRRLDEWSRLLAQMPPLETVFEVDYRLLAERLADIPDEVNGILRLFDGVRTFIQVVDDCGLSDLDAATIVGKLYGERIVRDVRGQPDDEKEPTGPDLDGWLTEAAGPFAAPAEANRSEGRKRGADASGVHGRPTAPVGLLDAPAPASSATERRERMTDRMFGEDPHPSGAPISEIRPDEPAVVIPFPTSSSPAMRHTLVSPSGGPAAAVAGEITNGVSTAAGQDGAGTATTAIGVAIPRSTDPGLGPPPPVGPPAAAEAPGAGQAHARPVPETPASGEPPLPRRDSAPKVAELPFSDSASRWMNEGDDIGRRRSEALDELGLPSRFRGLALVAAAAVLASGGFLAVRAMRGGHPAASATIEPASPAAAPVAPVLEPIAHVPAPPAVPPALAAAPIVAPPPAAAAAKAGQPATAVAAPGSAEPAPETSPFAQLLEACQTAFNAGRMKDATVACTAAKESNPESAQALGLLSHAEFNRNHRKEALSWAERTIKIDPKLADAYVIIGGVQQDAGHAAEAKAAYRRYLELAPKGQYASDLRAIIETL